MFCQLNCGLRCGELAFGRHRIFSLYLLTTRGWSGGCGLLPRISFENAIPFQLRSLALGSRRTRTRRRLACIAWPERLAAGRSWARCFEAECQSGLRGKEWLMRRSSIGFCGWRDLNRASIAVEMSIRFGATFTYMVLEMNRPSAGQLRTGASIWLPPTWCHCSIEFAKDR